MSQPPAHKVALLAGGVGGAKMAEGLASLDDIALSIIGNVADDEVFHGLWVSPDIDTLTYSLAGMIDRVQGWGVADEGKRALGILSQLGEETWMTLGDKDLGLHIYRTMRRKNGDRPFDIAQHVARSLGVKPEILLPTDDTIQTRLETEQGWLSFQQYFVREQCKPTVSTLRFDGINLARPTPEAIAALGEADIIVFAPSNPLVSIAPILAIPDIRDAVIKANAVKIAVSPLIAGKVVKGPADRMMTALGMRADSLGIAEHYTDLIDMLVIDHADGALSPDIEALGIKPIAESILMKSQEDKARLAAQVIRHALAFQSSGEAT
nr:2-phospho-L-lactate transferase [uncultured Cohaesibacter sp.]